MSSVAPRVPSQDSRDEILKAAMQLFASRGFHETSMSEVAREARVSKALIFWHFKTKEELFLAVLNRLLEPYYIDFSQEAQELDEAAQLQKLIELYLLFIRENASSVRFFLGRMMHDEEMPDAFTDQLRKIYDGYETLLVDLIRRAQQKGLCSTQYKPEVAGRVLMSALNGFLIEVLFMRASDSDFTETLNMLCALLFPGAGQPAVSVQAASAEPATNPAHRPQPLKS